MARERATEWTGVDAGLAVVLAWLIPGAGHLYLGRRRKAVVLFVLILGMFMAGQAMAQFKCVFYRSTPMLKSKLWFIGQAGVGLPTAVFTLTNDARAETDVYTSRVNKDGETERVRIDGEARLRFEMRPGFEIGTLWTTLAGLLNLLAAVNVYDIYYRRKHPHAEPDEAEGES